MNADFRHEVRAVYGGFGLAPDGLMLWGNAHSELAAGINLAAAVSLLGLAAGRIASWWIERSGPWPAVFATREGTAGTRLLVTT